jgi:hypothetical protein
MKTEEYQVDRAPNTGTRSLQKQKAIEHHNVDSDRAPKAVD